MRLAHEIVVLNKDNRHDNLKSISEVKSDSFQNLIFRFPKRNCINLQSEYNDQKVIQRAIHFRIRNYIVVFSVKLLKFEPKTQLILTYVKRANIPKIGFNSIYKTYQFTLI